MIPETDTEERLAPAAFWPEAMERGRLADAAFARAYARVPDRERSLLKTGIAAIYAACGGPLPPYRSQSAGLGHDLLFTRRDEPLDFAVVLCGPSFASPPRLAAAVIPALCARVPEVAAVRVGGAWPAPLLTTLELCGVETACRVGPRALSGVLRELGERGRGAVVLLDGVSPPARDVGGSLRLLLAQISGRAGLVSGPDAGPDAGPDDAFDRDALRLAHPDMTFYVHGGKDAGDASFAPAPGGLAEAAACGYAALYVAGDQLERACGAAPLVLGPGRETFWRWPQLAPDAFRRVTVAAGVDDRAATGC